MNSAEPAIALWARSGAMALSGRADGPPVVSPGNPAGIVHEQISKIIADTVARTGTTPTLPGVTLLSERAAIAGLQRQGPSSCGGAFRTMPTRDGWFGLSLARPEDVELIPALTGMEVDNDPWGTLSNWAASNTNPRISERAVLLGLPHAVWPALDRPAREPVLCQVGGNRSRLQESPVIVDMSSLWAGPLATHLLQLSGCTIIKIEDKNRPDGARRGPRKFFDLLNANKYMVAVDLNDKTEVRRLVKLMCQADLVIESSRPRALQNLGISAAEIVDLGTSWLSITARGRASDAVGFGDDVAVAGGLVVEQGPHLLPVGDALADPLSGVTAAAAASEALLSNKSQLIEVSMIDVASAAAAGGVPNHELEKTSQGWLVHSDLGRYKVLAPRARSPQGIAREVGQDTQRWLS